jgi:protein TonB
MLKSVVVLDVTIGPDGKLLRVAVRRSNGFKALENLAMDSVRRAAPFPAPAWAVRRGDGTVNFLETFLFRDDGRFRIRSLVAGL